MHTFNPTHSMWFHSHLCKTTCPHIRKWLEVEKENKGKEHNVPSLMNFGVDDVCHRVFEIEPLRTTRGQMYKKKEDSTILFHIQRPRRIVVVDSLPIIQKPIRYFHVQRKRSVGPQSTKSIAHEREEFNRGHTAHLNFLASFPNLLANASWRL